MVYTLLFLHHLAVTIAEGSPVLLTAALDQLKIGADRAVLRTKRQIDKS